LPGRNGRGRYDDISTLNTKKGSGEDESGGSAGRSEVEGGGDDAPGTIDVGVTVTEEDEEVGDIAITSYVEGNMKFSIVESEEGVGSGESLGVCGCGGGGAGRVGSWIVCGGLHVLVVILFEVPDVFRMLRRVDVAVEHDAD